jgi:BetI-type transcriptional repressor, C-terminal
MFCCPFGPAVRGTNGHRTVDAESVASILMALVDGLMIQWLLAPERCPPPEMLRRAATALSSLLATT